MEKESLERLIKTAMDVIDDKGLNRINGKVASLRTVDFSRQVIRQICRSLHALGYYLSDINGLKEKHVESLVRDWHAKGLSNKTMQNQLSRLRIFAGWLGKPEIVKAGGLVIYLPEVPAANLKVKTYTETSKSWTGNGIDIQRVIKAARLEDIRVWGMLLLGVSFGLRKKEMLRIKPWRADAGNELRIDGSVAKNGRPRSIPIDLEHPYGRFQRWCLDETKSICKRHETLGWPELTFKQSENRFYHYMTKLGITKIDAGVSAHGLRAEFAENMSLILGLVPPSLGGAIDQMAKSERKVITDAVSDLLGHDMEHTISAYFSTFRPVATIGGIGAQVGSTLIVDGDKDIFACMHINPMPVRSMDGSYRIQTASERGQTTITLKLEVPWADHQHFDVATFTSLYPKLRERIRRTLVAVGLGE